MEKKAIVSLDTPSISLSRLLTIAPVIAEAGSSSEIALNSSQASPPGGKGANIAHSCPNPAAAATSLATTTATEAGKEPMTCATTGSGPRLTNSNNSTKGRQSASVELRSTSTNAIAFRGEDCSVSSIACPLSLGAPPVKEPLTKRDDGDGDADGDGDGDDGASPHAHGGSREHTQAAETIGKIPSPRMQMQRPAWSERRRSAHTCCTRAVVFALVRAVFAIVDSSSPAAAAADDEEVAATVAVGIGAGVAAAAVR